MFPGIKKRKVHIVLGNHQVKNMFLERRHSWEVVDSLYSADLICFTGGEDISPSLYGENAHPKTGVCNIRRDTLEINAYLKSVQQKKAICGICRGTQLISALTGSKLLQHIPDAAHLGNHYFQTTDKKKKRINTTSVHHQMIIPNKENVKVLGIAKLITDKEFKHKEIEALAISDIRFFGVQGHPEYTEAKNKQDGDLALRQYFFDSITEHCFQE